VRIVLVLGLAVGLAAAVLAGTAVARTLYGPVSLSSSATFRVRDVNRGDPCPDLQRQVAPESIHLQPGLIQHVNWLEFRVPEPHAWIFAICADGRLHDLQQPAGREGSLLRFHLSTTWVGLQWLTHALDGYRDPRRWHLDYLVCPPDCDGPSTPAVAGTN
jgi:hypothetical protein